MAWADAVLSQASVMSILHLTGFEYCSEIWWRDDDEGNLRVLVNCSDFFAWGGSDAEEITEEELPNLIAAVEEAEKLLGKYNGEDGFLLWVARRRGLRPQGAYYKSLAPELWPAFDACGPARETGVLNPHPHPEDL